MKAFSDTISKWDKWECLQLTATIVDPSQEPDDHREDDEVRDQSDHPHHSASVVKVEEAFHTWN